MTTTQTELSDFIINLSKIITDRDCWLTSTKCDWSRYHYRKINGKQYALHRISAAAFIQGFSLQSNLDVLHKCDVKGCFNPEHLFVGNQTVNKNDYIRKKKYYDSIPYGPFRLEFETRLNKWFDLLGI